MNIGYKRHSGILLHITSLPSRYGIGDIGKGAYDFIGNLNATGSDLWQILPLGPTGYGNSPYSPRSSFASNELLISPDELLEDGYLEGEDLARLPSFNSGKVDFDKVINIKTPLLKKAARVFLEKNKEEEEFRAFLEREKYWIEDYALFMVLYEKYRDARWELWSRDERNRNQETLEKIRKEKGDDILIYLALQYLFSKQWKRLKRYANSLGIRIIGDIPIFVGKDSADVWSRKELFKRDENGHFNKVSGVPPDNFSATGQLWGNPVYDWKEHEKTDFRWWKERIKRTMEDVDILRIDHFRGFDAYYEIDSSEKTAANGVWKKSPGEKLFASMQKELGRLNIIAEDLGFITESVERLRDENGFPGMKIAHEGFIPRNDGDINALDTFLPHNYTRPFVAYTGTHDNDTTKGWFSGLRENEKKYVLEYLNCEESDVPWALMRAVMLSSADYAIFPMQDLLSLGSDARMNYPSTCNDKNWSWRMKDGDFREDVIKRMRRLNELSGRGNI